MKLKEEIAALIEVSRIDAIQPGVVADMILNKVFADDSIVVEEDSKTERPVNMREIVFIARKAVKQAYFDGAVVLSPSGKIIKRRN